MSGHAPLLWLCGVRRDSQRAVGLGTESGWLEGFRGAGQDEGSALPEHAYLRGKKRRVRGVFPAALLQRLQKRRRYGRKPLAEELRREDRFRAARMGVPGMRLCL